MLSWVEYEKSLITSGPSPVWSFIEDVCDYIYDGKAYKNLVYEPISTLSYSFISTSYPTGSEHQRIYSSLRVFAFMHGSRGGIGGPDLLENHNVED